MISGRLSARKNSRRVQLQRHWMLLLFVLPAVVYVALFNYAPMYGILMAFENYKPHTGVFGSLWTGLDNFRRLLELKNFMPIVRNTVVISAYSLLAGFPLPIVLALFLNSCPNERFKKLVQTVSYAPHFISTVVLCGMILIFFSPSQGIVRNILLRLGLVTGYVDVLTSAPAFPHLYVWSGVWQGVGFGSIIYLGALSGVDPSLHEAAIVDGANKVQRIRHIDIPTILPTMIVLLILNMGKVMNVGFEKVFLLQNSLNLETSQVLSTYTYQVGIKEGQYSFSTAVSLFNSVINFAMLLMMNAVARKVGETSLW